MEVVAVILSTFVVVVTGYNMIGEPARLVLIITIIAGSLAAGIATGSLIERKRSEKKTEPTSL